MEWELRPNESEVLGELERILSSAYFKSAAMQANILRLIVEKALQNEAIKELDIGYAVFEHYNPDSHKVRVNIALIRDKLSTYYSSEGNDDFVRISLPPGASYKPVFVYHEQADAIEKFTRGRRLMWRGSRAALAEAYELMLTKDRHRWNLPISFPPLRIATAECRLLQEIMGAIFGFRESGDSVGLAASSAIEVMMELAEEEGMLAYACIVKGAAHLMRNEIADAKCCFDLALEIDHDQTSKDAWYAVYKFIVTGEREDAHKIMESIVLKEPSNVGAKLVACLLLYADEKGPDAGLMAHGLSHWGAEAGSEALINVLTNLDFIAEHRNSEFWGEKERRDWISKEFTAASEVSYNELMINGRENNPAPRFQGLAILVIAAIEELKLTKELARFIRKSPFPKGLDWVLAYMAIGQMGRALIWYKHLCIKGVFLCPWLDLLPCFAPLARHPRFNEVRQHFRPEYHPKRRSD